MLRQKFVTNLFRNNENRDKGLKLRHDIKGKNQV